MNRPEPFLMIWHRADKTLSISQKNFITKMIVRISEISKNTITLFVWKLETHP